MARIYVRRITPAALAAGAFDNSVTVRVGKGTNIVDRISVESSEVIYTNAGVSFIYEEGDGTLRQSHLGHGFCTLRAPLVLRGPFEITGPGYIQLQYWIPEAGATAELVVVFSQRMEVFRP